MSDWVKIDSFDRAVYKSNQEFEKVVKFGFFTFYQNIRVLQHISNENVNFCYIRSLIISKRYRHEYKNRFYNIPCKIVKLFHRLLNKIIYKFIDINDFRNHSNYKKYLNKYPFLIDLFPDEIRDRKLKNIGIK